MTFAKAIKILDLLDHDKTIVVKELCDYESDENKYDCDYIREKKMIIPVAMMK